MVLRLYIILFACLYLLRLRIETIAFAWICIWIIFFLHIFRIIVLELFSENFSQFLYFLLMIEIRINLVLFFTFLFLRKNSNNIFLFLWFLSMIFYIDIYSSFSFLFASKTSWSGPQNCCVEFYHSNVTVSLHNYDFATNIQRTNSMDKTSSKRN